MEASFEWVAMAVLRTPRQWRSQVFNDWLDAWIAHGTDAKQAVTFERERRKKGMGDVEIPE